MYIGYDKKNGIKYAKLCSAERVDGKVVTKQKSLGRVIDEKKNIFHNRERGYFTYDPDTDTYSEVDSSAFTPIKRKNRKEKLLLDFGDAWFVDRFIRSTPLDKAIDELSGDNKDSVRAMVMFYILSSMENSCAGIWYDGSYARILYPEADLAREKINDILEEVGNERSKCFFFLEYFNYISRNRGKRENVIIDSVGLPESSHFPVTLVAWDDRIRDEIRLIYVVEKDTGLPVFFRCVTGSTPDADALASLVFELSAYGVDTSFTLPSPKIFNSTDITALYEDKVPFLLRLPEDTDLYRTVVREYFDNLERAENALAFNNSLIYILRKKVLFSPDGGSRILEDDENPLPEEGNTAYVYLGMDSIAEDIERLGIFEDVYSSGYSIAEMNERLSESGIFVLLSSLRMEKERVLSSYYARHWAGRDFLISDRRRFLAPYISRSGKALGGHLMLTFISTIVVRMMEEKLEKAGMSSDEALYALRNHKCRVKDGKVVPEKKTKKEESILRLFKFRIPSEISF